MRTKAVTIMRIMACLSKILAFSAMNKYHELPCVSIVFVQFFGDFHKRSLQRPEDVFPSGLGKRGWLVGRTSRESICEWVPTPSVLADDVLGVVDTLSLKTSQERILQRDSFSGCCFLCKCKQVMSALSFSLD